MTCSLQHLIRAMDIWEVELTDATGNETLGRRPAVVMAVHTQTEMYMVVPLTSNMDANRFPNTCDIPRSTRNQLYMESVAMIFQMRCLCQDRFIHKIGILEKTHFDRIGTLIKNFLQL